MVETPGDAMSKSRKLIPPCFTVLVGADEAEDPVGLVGIAGPDLLAVDDEIVAVIDGRGGEAGEVGAGVGLRIALAPADFAARDLRQMRLLLFLGAIFQQRRPEHRDAEGIERAATAEASPFPRATPWTRPVSGRRRHIASGQSGTVQPRCRHAVEPRASARARRIAHCGRPSRRRRIRSHRLAHLRRTIRLEPGARLRARKLSRSLMT